MQDELVEQLQQVVWSDVVTRPDQGWMPIDPKVEKGSHALGEW